MSAPRSILAVVSLVASVAHSVPAAAEGTEGKVQLGLNVPIFAYTTGTAETPALGGINVEQDVSRTSWGIAMDPLLEIGYGVSDMFVVGGVAQIGGQSVTVGDADDADISATTIFLAPKLDVMFSADATVRPFLSGALGLVSSSMSTGATETSALGVGLFARAGLRWFAAPAASLDASLGFLWQTASGDTGTDALKTDISVSGISILGTLGISAWL